MPLNTDINRYSGDLDRFLGGLGQRTTDFFGGQYGKITDFLNRYRQGIMGQESLPAMSERIGKELNIPTLRENALAINKTANELPATYTAATRGYDVNANQLGRIVGTKQAAIAPAVSAANTAYQTASDQANARMGIEQAQQSKELLPFQSEQAMLTDYQAREFSGFSQENQAKLNGYIQKMQGGIQLSVEEAQEANELALAKMRYDHEMRIAKMNPFGI